MEEPSQNARSIEANAQTQLRLSVIIPARNEADSLPACLDSLLAQSEPGFALGLQWELLLVDDDSTDQTPEIARAAAAAHPGVIVLEAPPLDLSDRGGFTGKNNACWTAAQRARGAWFLFTDADTIHQPGDLSRALHEAGKYNASLLSYSPRQLVTGFWQNAVMPLIFSELASVYPAKHVGDPNSRLAAANGQFLLV
ncbi:MAG TPA: glycosyltransferase family 2 protein, partial [Acidobacteriaceae bacterium]|nr:glycosyltransferase family 2 protein [Acidobacteriaceae bacterium]